MKKPLTDFLCLSFRVFRPLALGLIFIGLIPATFAAASNLYVGQYTSGVVVTITSSTNYNNTYVGYTNTASNNELIIVNSGTVLTNEAPPPLLY